MKPLSANETDDLQVIGEAKSAPQIVPIRTETALTRFPIHRLAKKGEIKIRQTKKSEKGKTLTTWQVMNPPGPLAYKLDTIIVNRRIDELRPNIPKLIKLGTLRGICDELGIVVSGKTVDKIKEALRENAFTGITARLDYSSQGGVEKHFEFSDTRYAVIFTGEKLPNGRVSDGVYIYLHDLYLSLLNHSTTRPLDYDYLRELPPASQRLYELLSFAVFGALKHGRPNAHMLYSELCSSAPLTQYSEWAKAKKQLYKIHRPHIESGYLETVEYEETLGTGVSKDWIIRYVPGERARREYIEFNTRKYAEHGKKSASPRLIKPVLQEEKKAIGEVHSALISRLMEFGIDERRAIQLVENDQAECALWANAWPHQNRRGMENPPAVLASFIEKKRRPLPKGNTELGQKEKAKKISQVKGQDLLQVDYRREVIETSLSSLAPEWEKIFEKDFQEFKESLNINSDSTSEGAVSALRLIHFERFCEENQELAVMSYEEWLRKK